LLIASLYSGLKDFQLFTFDSENIYVLVSVHLCALRCTSGMS